MVTIWEQHKQKVVSELRAGQIDKALIHFSKIGEQAMEGILTELSIKHGKIAKGAHHKLTKNKQLTISRRVPNTNH